METVLVVEDNRAAQYVMAVVLEGDGFNVLCASSAEEAHSVCIRYAGPIHLMVTDAALRSATGKELARQITEIRPEMKVLYVSGYSRAELLAKGELDPDAPFLRKPFTGDILANAVRRLLDGCTAVARDLRNRA